MKHALLFLAIGSAGCIGVDDPETSTTAQGITTYAESDAAFGWSMVSADFDGDGIDDLAVSAPWGSGVLGASGGVVEVYRGTPNGLVLWQELTEFPMNLATSSDDEFGFALAAADFDGDNKFDLVISAPRARSMNHPAKGGVVYVLFGSSHGLSSSNAITLDQTDSTGALSEDGDRFGAALATGRLAPSVAPGLAVGAPGENHQRGYVNTFTFDRSSHAFFNLHGIALPDADTATWGGFGSSLAISDFNLDNLGDVVVGAGEIQYAANEASYNYVPELTYVAAGKPGGFEPPVAIAPPANHCHPEGYAFAVGHFDGAQYSVAPIAGHLKNELAVGAPYCFNGTTLLGRVEIYRPNVKTDGSFTMVESQELGASFDAFAPNGNQLGWSLATAKLVSKTQTLDDLVVGIPEAPLRGSSDTLPGAIGILHGANGGMIEGANITSVAAIDGDGQLQTPASDRYLGRAVAAGDIYGSGRSAVVGGMPSQTLIGDTYKQYDAGAFETFVGIATDAFIQVGYYDQDTKTN